VIILLASEEDTMASKKTITVYEVLADGSGPGPAGDGTFVRRFRDEKAAKDFAAGATCYGREATASAFEAPLALARRWGLA
jgi:hypothetical protein